MGSGNDEGGRDDESTLAANSSGSASPHGSSSTKDLPKDDSESILDSESSEDVRSRRLDRSNARVRISMIVRTGELVFTKHCKQELSKDEMTSVDVANVLRCGKIHREPEVSEKTGAWRYRIETSRMAVIVEFSTERALVVVTAWRVRV